MKRNSLLNLGVAAVITLAGVVVLPSPASAALTLVREVAWSASDPSDSKAATATCPANTRVVGGGADVLVGSNNVHITGLQPNGTANTFTAFAREHHATDWDWQLVVHAVCAPALAGLTYVSEVTGGDSPYSHTDAALCPSGTKVLGTGARVTANDTSKVLLTYVRPTSAGSGAESGAVEMAGGYSGNWWLHTWAICANAPAGWEIVTHTGGPQGLYAGFSCPDSKKLTGAGAFISLSLGKIFLVDVTVMQEAGDPSVPDGVSLAVGAIDSGYSHEWAATAYGVCVT